MKPKSCSTWEILLLVLSVCVFNDASAQVFPSKPVRWIVPFPAGGTGDLLVRTLSPTMGKALGHNVIADFRPGGRGVIGAQLTLQAPADGHTMLFAPNGFTTNAAVRTNLPYDTLKDFTGVARIVTTPLMMVAHPSVPVRSLKEMLALARARPGEVTYGTLGTGGLQHLAMEMLSQSTKVNLLQVPYQGTAPQMISVLGGHVALAVTNVPDAAPQIEAGKLRAIAVTSPQRSPAAPTVPTVAESGFPGYDMQLWIGAVMARGTPRDAVNRLGAEIVRAVGQPEVRDALAKVGFVPAPLNPEQFDAFIRSEIESNGKIARAANIRLD